MNSEICCLRYEEERVLASFTRRLIEIAATAGARGQAKCPITALNEMCLPAVALDRQGFVADVNAAAGTLFDDDLKIKDRRLFVRDRAARALLEEALDQLKKPRLIPLDVKPFVVRRSDKFPLVLRIWSLAGPARLPGHRSVSPVHAVLSMFSVLATPRQTPYVM